MLFANQDSNNLIAFRIDGSTGTLLLVGQVAPIPSAVCP